MGDPDDPEGLPLDERGDDARPNIARVYDYVVGGAEYREIDREFAEEMLVVVPGIAEVIRELRDFDMRVVAHLAEHGIDQFLDLGSGLPSYGATHRVAVEHGVVPRVVYVDNDPEAVTHGRRIVADAEGVAAVLGDVGDLPAVLADAEVRSVLDLDRPVAVLACAVLQYLDDAAASDAVSTLRAAAAPGSRLVVANLSGRGRPEALQWAQRRHSGLSIAPRVREPEQMAGWLAGWDVVAPGWTAATTWDPSATSGADPASVGAAYWVVTAERR